MKGRRDRSGQAAVEYVLVFVALIAVVLVLWHFVSVVRRSARQTVELVTSDYP